MSKKLEDILAKLRKLGWIDLNDNHTDFHFGETNRWIELDGEPLKYIDFYIYHDEEEFGGYLTIEEYKLFGELIDELMNTKKDIL